MSASAPLPAVTIVIPIYNEEAVLPELCRRLAAVFDAHPGIKWDALLVNDGSRDESAALVREMAARDPRFALLEFSRNFGFRAALARGDRRAPARHGCVSQPVRPRGGFSDREEHRHLRPDRPRRGRRGQP